MRLSIAIRSIVIAALAAVASITPASADAQRGTPAAQKSKEDVLIAMGDGVDQSFGRACVGNHSPDRAERTA